MGAIIVGAGTIDVYLERGAKRTFAGALDWPGWCRGGRDEASALQSLLDYGPRYVEALAPAGLKLQLPADSCALSVVEQLEGDATTDFGAPGAAPSYDALPLDEPGLRRLERLLQACWQAFDRAAQGAVGKELQKGPRGGGRDLDKLIAHVLDVEAAYLRQLGWKLGQGGEKREERVAELRKAALEALAAAARGEIPARGPRGGERWTARYFVRRAAWHLLDHAWELEDRSA
jgi:hypothetical protein